MIPICVRFVLLLTAAAAPALSCLNEYHPGNTKAIERSQSIRRQIEEQAPENRLNRVEQLRSEMERGDYRTKNDLAVALAHAGQAAEAVTLLEGIEREKPGLYVTAANLGTAYELVGNNTRALDWIRQGIQRNPDSHQGSEWLHVRILEAKLALEKDPSWLGDHSILGFSGHALPQSVDIRGNRGEKLKLDGIKDALIYQLHERVQFVGAPDAVVGSLLYDLGLLIAEESSGPGGAKDVLSMARTYLTGLPNVEFLYQVNNSLIIKASAAQVEERESGPGVLIYTVIFLLVLLMVSILKRSLTRFRGQPRTELEL